MRRNSAFVTRSSRARRCDAASMPADVSLASLERERKMTGIKRVDCKPAKLAQRMHELLQAAVVDVLEQDRAAVEDNVAAEQAAPPRVLEQEREMAARVPGRLDAHDDEIADRNEVAVDELDLDLARIEPVLGRVDPGALG